MQEVRTTAYKIKWRRRGEVLKTTLYASIELAEKMAESIRADGFKVLKVEETNG